MHPKIAELLRYLDAQHENLRRTFESIPARLRGERPSPMRWSAAEIVQHLALVERRLAQRLASMIDQARALPPDDDVAPYFPSDLVTTVEVRSRRVTTSQAAEPRDADPGRVWDEYAAVRAELKDVIATGDGLQLGALTAPHPALGAISGYDWIAFAGAHAARHADQIREVASELEARVRDVTRE